MQAVPIGWNLRPISADPDKYIVDKVDNMREIFTRIRSHQIHPILIVAYVTGLVLGIIVGALHVDIVEMRDTGAAKYLVYVIALPAFIPLLLFLVSMFLSITDKEDIIDRIGSNLDRFGSNFDKSQKRLIKKMDRNQKRLIRKMNDNQNNPIRKMDNSQNNPIRKMGDNQNKLIKKMSKNHKDLMNKMDANRKALNGIKKALLRIEQLLQSGKG